MKIQCLTETLNETNGYILIDENSKHCIIVDPCNAKLIDEYIKENDLSIDFCLLTHEHFDHIFGLNQLREKYHFELICNASCSIGIQSAVKNMVRCYEIVLGFRKEKYHLEDLTIPDIDRNYVSGKAEIEFDAGYGFEWYGHRIELRHTPGHSKGSACITVDDNMMFSGDSLLFDYDVILRFPGGSKKEYQQITLPFFNRLDRNIFVYPGHGRAFRLGDKMEQKGDT